MSTNAAFPDEFKFFETIRFKFQNMIVELILLQRSMKPPFSVRFLVGPQSSIMNNYDKFSDTSSSQQDATGQAQLLRNDQHMLGIPWIGKSTSA